MKRIRKIFELSLYATLCLAVTVSGTRVSADLSQYDIDSVYGTWENWVPDQAQPADSCILGSIDLQGNANVEKIYNYLLTRGLTNIQAIGLMANLQAESHFEPRLVEYGFPNSRGEISKAGSPTSLDDNVPPTVNSHGQPGYGLAQWSGGRKDNLKSFATQYVPAGATQPGVQGSDLAMQLDFLWQELSTSYSTSVLTPLKSITSLNDAVDLVLTKFEVPADIGKHTPEREAIGMGLYQKLGGTTAPAAATNSTTAAVSAGPTTTSGCDIVASGNTVQTALNLAWPTTGHGKYQSDATIAYQAAEPKYNGSTGDDEFSDCGVFVATVMVASGADKDYPKRGTTAQMTYLSSSSKYTEITSTNTADLKPGDIFITDGHTYMYVGTQPGGYNSVGGSLHDHVPQAAGEAHFTDNYGPGGSLRVYKVFRLKGTPA
jgi:hypothetical protein